MTKYFYILVGLFASSLVSAQTVTVGSLTSVQNGTTTTITVPVSVAVPPGGSGTSTMLSSLAATAGGGNGLSATQQVGSSFTTVVMPAISIDTASGWNSNSNAYIIPVTGTYLIVSNIRLVDYTPPGISYGIGVGSVNVDSPTFTWTTTAGRRNVLSNTRLAYLTAGTSINLFVYADVSTPVSLSSASLNIQQLQ